MLFGTRGNLKMQNWGKRKEGEKVPPIAKRKGLDPSLLRWGRKEAR